jgi:hypothetical protein
LYRRQHGYDFQVNQLTLGLITNFNKFKF